MKSASIRTIILSTLLLFTSSVFADPAPTFSVKDSTGVAHTLTQYKGTIVVLEWFSPECPFVKKFYETGTMQSLQEKYTSKGGIWLSVDSSGEGRPGYLSPKEADAFRKTAKTKSTALILDPEGSLGKEFGAKTTPHFFIIDTEGNLAYEGAIDDAPTTTKESITNAHSYVSQALDELIAGKKVSTPATESYGCSIKYAM